MLADPGYLVVNVSSDGPEPDPGVLDLSYLTEKEKEWIRRVTTRDVMLSKESLW